MSLVFAAACSHAPGITGRAKLAEPALKDALHDQLRRLGETMRETMESQLDAERALRWQQFAENRIDLT